MLICTTAQSHLVRVAFVPMHYESIALSTVTIRSIEASNLMPSFFIYYSVSRSQITAKLSRKAATTSEAYQRNITREALRIPVPPLPEQQRIVGILDEAFEGIATAKANAEKNLQNARALFESHLQSVFTQRGKGWVEKRLAEVMRRSITDGMAYQAANYVNDYE